MHNSTVIMLMFLMLGQILILSFAVFVLWLTGDFGDSPKLFSRRHSVGQAGKPASAMRVDTGRRSKENGDGLMSLEDSHSIQPQAPGERIGRLEGDVKPARDRAA
jgi:hypothetical protein